MSGLLDTSIVVRYLTGDPPELAERASRIIDTDESLRVTDVLVAEVGYALTSVYAAPRKAVFDSLVAFVQKRNILPYSLSKEALLLCRSSGRVSFADAMVWAVARSSERLVYSSDRRFPTEGIEVRESRRA